MPDVTVCDPRTEVDVRGPRFSAAITLVVLAAALLTLGSPVAVVLIAIQTVVFALGAFVGLRAQPYGILFRSVVQPRLAPATEFESVAPPRFAALVGFIFTAVALLGLATGLTTVAYVAVSFALAAAFLNAAFGFCLGCEMYLIGKRMLARPVTA
ncbi:MAG: DUF4395 domain-containing protein [Candidatus Nanopelagicales bacterium]|nr:DUF4395 domain-containing protein [Candidatus Nanopelagicales bacterium]